MALSHLSLTKRHTLLKIIGDLKKISKRHLPKVSPLEQNTDKSFKQGQTRPTKYCTNTSSCRLIRRIVEYPLKDVNFEQSLVDNVDSLNFFSRSCHSKFNLTITPIDTCTFKGFAKHHDNLNADLFLSRIPSFVKGASKTTNLYQRYGLVAQLPKPYPSVSGALTSYPTDKQAREKLRWLGKKFLLVQNFCTITAKISQIINKKEGIKYSKFFAKTFHNLNSLRFPSLKTQSKDMPCDPLLDLHLHIPYGLAFFNNHRWYIKANNLRCAPSLDDTRFKKRGPKKSNNKKTFKQLRLEDLVQAWLGQYYRQYLSYQELHFAILSIHRVYNLQQLNNNKSNDNFADLPSSTSADMTTSAYPVGKESVPLEVVEGLPKGTNIGKVRFPLTIQDGKSNSAHSRRVIKQACPIDREPLLEKHSSNSHLVKDMLDRIAIPAYTKDCKNNLIRVLRTKTVKHERESFPLIVKDCERSREHAPSTNDVSSCISYTVPPVPPVPPKVGMVGSKAKVVEVGNSGNGGKRGSSHIVASNRANLSNLQQVNDLQNKNPLPLRSLKLFRKSALKKLQQTLHKRRTPFVPLDKPKVAIMEKQAEGMLNKTLVKLNSPHTVITNTLLKGTANTDNEKMVMSGITKQEKGLKVLERINIVMSNTYASKMPMHQIGIIQGSNSQRKSSQAINKQNVKNKPPLFPIASGLSTRKMFTYFDHSIYLYWLSQLSTTLQTKFYRTVDKTIKTNADTTIANFFVAPIKTFSHLTDKNSLEKAQIFDKFHFRDSISFDSHSLIPLLTDSDQVTFAAGSRETSTPSTKLNFSPTNIHYVSASPFWGIPLFKKKITSKSMGDPNFFQKGFPLFNGKSEPTFLSFGKLKDTPLVNSSTISTISSIRAFRQSFVDTVGVIEAGSASKGQVTMTEHGKKLKNKISKGDSFYIEGEFGQNPQQFYVFPGQLVTYGDTLASNVVTTESGQVLYVDSQKITLRRAQTVLIYSQAIIAVLSGEWIKKGTPLMSLSYQKLVTGDIVQGLPKIEQFFEAPMLKDGTFWGDSLQAKLNQFFQEERERLPLAEAVRKGFSEIQRVLVEGVQRVYISQGVLIADKHLEVIVRQMTCKGRILYSGDTGFLRNELVSLDKIENVNQVTYGQKALYHPQVRGITDASLESESFLSAASFQETTRVLSRDAIVGKTDLMRGLKERVIVGELIQAGTGLANNTVYNLL